MEVAALPPKLMCDFPATGYPVSCSISGLARRFKSRGHREQPKISEGGICPSRVIAKTSTLTRTTKPGRKGDCGEAPGDAACQE